MNGLRNVTQTVEVSGVALEAVMIGDGKPLLFLHGSEGLDATTDRHLLELASHFRVIAPWHPGFGLQGAAGGIARG